MQDAPSPFDLGLDRVDANHQPLTPLTFLRRAAAVYPDKTAVIHGDWRANYREFYARSRRLASALKRFGMEDVDFADGGSDRLIDTCVAWGDEQAIAARVRAHHDAGADHVCVQTIDPSGSVQPDWRALEAVAAA